MYELGRGHLVASASRFLKESTNVAAQQVGGRVRPRAGTTEGIERGDGAVVSSGGEDLAVSRDTDGKLHALKAACTHMGCIVAWNKAESSWDCPCHGSRFAVDGRVLHGPAIQLLESAPLPAPDDDNGSA